MTLDEIQAHALLLLNQWNAAKVPGDWDLSPFEQRYVREREKAYETPGELEKLVTLIKDHPNDYTKPRWGKRWMLSNREAEYYYSRIIKKFGRNFSRVLEIGSGYGLVAEKLFRRLPIREYYIVDLPDTLPLIWAYLRSQEVPNLHTHFSSIHNEFDIAPPGTGIHLVPPWLISEIPGPVDLFLNHMSFQHMTQENLDFYFPEMERLECKKMHLVNRRSKRAAEDVPIQKYNLPDCYNIDIFGLNISANHEERFYTRVKT